MRYNKDFTKKDGRILTGSGPRDIQRRQSIGDTQNLATDKDVIIELLRNEIVSLKVELSNHSNGRGTFTAEDLDIEINKEVTKAIKDIETKYSNKISNLEQLILSKKDLIAEKDERIKELKQMVGTVRLVESDVGHTEQRPKIDEVFVDPLESDAGKNIESHIKVTEETTENIGDKAKKLKSIFGGKLPLGR